jgi:DNA-binding transcriptional ArsR family regulator
MVKSNTRELALPKRSQIERLVRHGPVCTSELISFLQCLGANEFNEAACAKDKAALEECVAQAKARASATVNKKPKSTVMYHLKRLYYMRKR